MKFRRRYWYAIVLIINVFVACVAFIKFRMHPMETAFSDNGDGLKNYFTLYTFVKEPITKDGIFKYNSFKYPFGDYVYYTDNTALFSVPLRWFCHNVWDISDYSIPLFNLFVVLNVVVAGLMLFYILRRICNDNLLSLILSVIMTWTNTQVLRIWRGHFNLSFSSLILAAIMLMMAWHRYKDSRRGSMIIGSLMSLLIYFGSMEHGYYSLILGCFISGFLMTYGILHFKNRNGILSIIMSLISPVLALGLTFATILSTDKYFSIRKTAPNGYDWSEQKVVFSRLFSHYPFQNLVFPVSLHPSLSEPEIAAYLGNIGLFSLAAFVLCAVFSKSFRGYFVVIQRNFFSDPLKKSIFFGGVVLLSIGFGENYYTGGPNMDFNRYHLINIFNPLFYLHFFTDRVEQFRCLARLMWPFWFTFNIWISYSLVAIANAYGKKIRIAILVSVLFVGGAELKDYVDYFQDACGRPNYLDSNFIHQAHYNPAFADCQAIIPIPFYLVGSETSQLVIDDYEGWSNFSYRLAVRSKLPLIASKLSRTPTYYDSLIMNMMTTDKIDSPLLQRLSAKPILIVVNKKLIADHTLPVVPVQEDRARNYWLCNQFVERKHLVPIDSCEDVLYYKWYPKS